MPPKHKGGGCGCCTPPTCWPGCEPTSIEVNGNGVSGNLCCGEADGTYAISDECSDSYVVTGTFDVDWVITAGKNCDAANCTLQTVSGTAEISVCDTHYSNCTHQWITLSRVFIGILRTYDSMTGAMTITVTVDWRYSVFYHTANVSGPSGAACGKEIYASGAPSYQVSYAHVDTYELELAACEDVVDNTEIPYVSRTGDTSITYRDGSTFNMCDPATVTLRV